jgi:hypothetical protein
MLTEHVLTQEVRYFCFSLFEIFAFGYLSVYLSVT